MTSMSPSQSIRGSMGHVTVDRISFRALLSAEFRRARQTRPLVALITVVVGITLVVLAARVILNDTTPGSETVTLGTDFVGFAVLLGVAITVAKDYQTGTVDLLRALVPKRACHLAARAVSTGLLALIAVGVVLVAGLLALLALNPTAVDFELVDTIVRTVTTTFVLAWMGVGIGALTRSPAAATFVVIALYWLLPVAMIVAGISGIGWATSLSDATLGILAGKTILPGPSNWAATGGVALWAATLTILGIFRDTKGN